MCSCMGEIMLTEALFAQGAARFMRRGSSKGRISIKERMGKRSTNRLDHSVSPAARGRFDGDVEAGYYAGAQLISLLSMTVL
jgi:hypothetical protein